MPNQESLIAYKVGLADPPNNSGGAKILTLTDTIAPHKMYMALLSKQESEELRDALIAEFPPRYKVEKSPQTPNLIVAGSGNLGRQ